jgi:hypothetical protein
MLQVLFPLPRMPFGARSHPVEYIHTRTASAL